jgi:hypothetical protein
MKTLNDYPVAKEIARQIGGNIWAISGGRVRPYGEYGAELPCGSGYVVRIKLNAMDYYDVSRVFKRAGKEFIHGERKDVDCFEISEVAYYASCYRSYDENEWVTKA